MKLSSFAEGLEGNPSFQPFLHEDVNPLGNQLKMRMLYAPNRPMRIVHKRLREYLKVIMPPLPHATGALPGCSPKTNVTRHCKSRYFYLTDITSAYKGTNLEVLAEVLTELDDSLDKEETVEFLGKFCFLPEGGLVTGAPACPDLYNIYAGIRLDLVLGEYCKSKGLVMTRYLDDITISSSDENGPIGKHKRRTIRNIIASCGFAMNHQKTFVYDLTKGPVVINGIGLEWGGRMYLPRWYLRLLRGMMKRSAKDPNIELSTIAGRMGVFWSSTEKDKLNRTERKLVSQFKRTKKSLMVAGRF